MTGENFVGDVVIRGVEELFTNVMRQRRPAPRSGPYEPPVDVYETETEFVVVMDIAGVDASSVDVDVAGDEVTIAGERRLRVDPGDDDGSDPLRTEIAQGRFERTLGLPLRVEGTSALASYRAGLLTVRLPKQRTRPDSVRVQVRDLGDGDADRPQ